MPFRSEEEAALIRVGSGTASGEVFRRYWLPVECSANRGSGLTTNPLRVPVLGEHLALCRDGAGKPGLLGEHRGHRGASLACGRVEPASRRAGLDPRTPVGYGGKGPVGPPW
jgi:hypothetical protein